MTWGMQRVSALVSKDIGNYLTNKKTWEGVLYNVKEYGATGDGSTDDSADLGSLITLIGSDSATIGFPSGTYVIGSNLTFPSNITLWFFEGAMLSPSTGITVTINGEIDAGMTQIFTGAGTIAGDKRNAYVFPQWWGVKGDNVTDDLSAMQKAINACQNSKDTLYVPYSGPGYKFVGGLVITNPFTMICDQTTVFRFTLAASTDIAIKIQYTFNQGYYQFPILTGNKIGTGIQIRGASVVHLQCKYIDFFQNGLHLYAKDHASENNYIDIDIIENVGTGILMEGDGLSCDIHQIFVNTIANCQYGIRFLELNSGNVADNWIVICQLWTEIDNGVCFYTESASIPDRNKIEVQYLRSDSTAGQTVPYVGTPSVGTPGKYFSGVATQGTENMFEGSRNRFEIGLIGPSTAIKLFIKGFDNTVSPITTETSATAGTFYGTPQTASNSRTAYGLPSYFRKTLTRISVPAGTAGSQIDRYIYHQFCSHTFSGMVQIIPASGYGNDFLICGEDVSYNNNHELAIHIKYLQTTGSAQNADFYVLFE